MGIMKEAGRLFILGGKNHPSAVQIRVLDAHLTARHIDERSRRYPDPTQLPCIGRPGGSQSSAGAATSGGRATN